VTMINALLANGWDPDTAVRAVMAGDLMSIIGSHSGLYSVQLQSLEAIQAAAESAAGAEAARMMRERFNRAELIEAARMYRAELESGE
jgi:hypothetical protein